MTHVLVALSGMQRYAFSLHCPGRESTLYWFSRAWRCFISISAWFIEDRNPCIEKVSCFRRERPL
jgi:hypothetical protein